MNETPPEIAAAIRAIYIETGRQGAKARLNRAYAEVDRLSPGLDKSLRDEYAQKLYRDQLAEAGRRSGEVRRAKRDARLTAQQEAE